MIIETEQSKHKQKYMYRVTVVLKVDRLNRATTSPGVDPTGVVGDLKDTYTVEKWGLLTFDPSNIPTTVKLVKDKIASTVLDQDRIERLFKWVKP